jgi:hypothetical protein
MKLFTKPGCKKCDYVKQFIPRETEIQTYNIATAEGLAELAYNELVSVAERELPILVVREGQPITGAIKIKKAFKDYC